MRKQLPLAMTMRAMTNGVAVLASTHALVAPEQAFGLAVWHLVRFDDGDRRELRVHLEYQPSEFTRVE